MVLMKKKVLLITGGTGSFGNAVIDEFLGEEFDEIRIFSRDEKKQDEMRRKYSDAKLKFYIGDVRLKSSIDSAMQGVSYVFHAAALKQVPSCEFYPMEAVRTNVLGTENVVLSAIENKVKKLVCLSTDKAVYPINAMGVSKAMMEKVVVAASRLAEGTETIVCCTRYGNVMASRGSVIPLFFEQIKNGVPITITNGNMTRFMMTLHNAVKLVDYAFKNGKNGDIFVQKSPSATISTLLSAILKLNKLKDYPVKNIGNRHGEKMYEVLVSTEEMSNSVDLGDYYKIPADNRDLNYNKYFEYGRNAKNEIDLYSSHNTRQLNVQEMCELLLNVNFVKEQLLK
jgi:UDP-N-acetylglucosamine 4,6-dehydratase/5-epimerase